MKEYQKILEICSVYAFNNFAVDIVMKAILICKLRIIKGCNKSIQSS